MLTLSAGAFVLACAVYFGREQYDDDHDDTGKCVGPADGGCTGRSS